MPRKGQCRPCSASTRNCGVYFYKNKWKSCIRVNNKNIHLGTFESYEQALTSRKEAERRYWPAEIWSQRIEG